MFLVLIQRSLAEKLTQRNNQLQVPRGLFVVVVVSCYFVKFCTNILFSTTFCEV